jgi:trehalose 6-phosphate phosphatase
MRSRPRPPPPPLHGHCAVFLDIDCTLLELAPAPDQVHVSPALEALLVSLRQRLDGALALVTGRAIGDVDRLFPGMRMAVAGQHGCERRDAEGTLHLYAGRTATLEQLRTLFTAFARRHDGLLLEDKGASLALHYRGAPELAAHVHRTMRETVAASGSDGYRLEPGKRLVELRPDARDKGTAIRDFMTEPPFRDRRPVFVGDDLGDEHGFTVVRQMGGWAVKVGPGATRAQYRLPDVAAVVGWLATPSSKAADD